MVSSPLPPPRGPFLSSLDHFLFPVLLKAFFFFLFKPPVQAGTPTHLPARALQAAFLTATYPGGSRSECLKYLLGLSGREVPFSSVSREEKCISEREKDPKLRCTKAFCTVCFLTTTTTLDCCPRQRVQRERRQRSPAFFVAHNDGFGKINGSRRSCCCSRRAVASTQFLNGYSKAGVYANGWCVGGRAVWSFAISRARASE